jgi:hypothetical protein
MRSSAVLYERGDIWLKTGVFWVVRRVDCEIFADVSKGRSVFVFIKTAVKTRNISRYEPPSVMISCHTQKGAQPIGL